MQQSAATKNNSTRNKKKLFIIFIGIFIPTLNINADLGIQNTYQISQQHFSQAYPTSEEKPEPEGNESELPEIILTSGEKRKIILKALTRQTINQENSKNSILTQYAVKDLDLLNGSTLSPDHSILRSLGKTITVSGEIMLANILITPTTDINTLKRRQAVIQYLIDNPVVMNKLENHLRNFFVNEDGIISLLDPSDTIYKGLFQSLDATSQFGLNPKSSNGKKNFPSIYRESEFAQSWIYANVPVLLFITPFTNSYRHNTLWPHTLPSAEKRAKRKKLLLIRNEAK